MKVNDGTETEKETEIPEVRLLEVMLAWHHRWTRIFFGTFAQKFQSKITENGTCNIFFHPVSLCTPECLISLTEVCLRTEKQWCPEN